MYQKGLLYNQEKMLLKEKIAKMGKIYKIGWIKVF